MELKDFVRDTIMQICEGVKEAQEAGKGIGVEVNPHLKRTPDIVFDGDDHKPLRLKTDIRFRAVLQHAEGSKDKRGIGVMFANVTLGAAKDVTQDLSSLTSVEFSVPVAFPFQPL